MAIAKEIAVKIDADELMVSVFEEGRMVEIYFERQKNQNIVGNIYKGVVENVLPGMQAAFVDIGTGKNGFLYINDAVPRSMDEEGNVLEPQYPIDQVLKTGQEITVQIVKEPVGTKGARVTTHPTLPGRYVVLMPTVKYIGISRRIENDEERERLRALGAELVGSEMGLIIRTVAEGVGKEELAADIKRLMRSWKRIQGKALSAKAPVVIHKDSNLLERLVRDIFVGEVKKVYLSSYETKEKLMDMIVDIVPEIQDKLEILAGTDIMELYDLKGQLEKTLKKKVWLDCGGYIIIDHMEALTVIDVNTGKFVGETSLGETVLQTNIEAAREIARQIRLRNVGGIIIVDFIDMKPEEDKEKVTAALAEELKKDRIKTNILGLTQLGLLEMTRKKNGYQLSDVLQRDCPVCGGRGKVLSEESVYLNMKKEILRLGLESSAPAIYIEANPMVAAYIIGAAGSNMAFLERETAKLILLKASPGLKMDDYIIRPSYEAHESSRVLAPVKVGEVLSVYIDEPHAERETEGIARVDGFVLSVENAAKHVGETIAVKVTELQKTYGKAIVLDEICL